MENYKKVDEDYLFTIIRLNIKKYRKMRNLTTQELADKADLTHQFIRDLECVKIIKRPRMDTIVRIINALEIKITDLFDESIIQK